MGKSTNETPPAEAEDTDLSKTGQTMIEQAMAQITKQGKEAVVGKLKDILKRRMEAQKTVALCDAEAKKLVSDFEAGLL